MREALIRLLDPAVVAEGCELVELEYHPQRGGGLLRLYIDRPDAPGPHGGVTVEDCEAVSRRVSALLEQADPIAGGYTLEVSSPGFDRPLRTLAHYRRFEGSRLRVESHLPRDGRRRWTGRLVAVAPTGVRLEVDGQIVDLQLSEIKTARLAPLHGTRRE